jgi:phospholipase C
MNLNFLQGRFKDFEDFESELNKSHFGDKFVFFIEPKYGSHKFDVTGPDFRCGNSMHPLDDVTRGEELVKKVYETIRASPLWNKSVLLIVFDEHGGFYDHVAPPAAVPPGDLVNAGYVKQNFKFDQLGVRVPAIVISPYTPKNVIDHTIYDHTSMLATVEKLYGIRNLTERDRAANNFLHLMSLDKPRTDCPRALPPAATPDPQLICETDDETEDQLLYTRSELRIARDKKNYRDRHISRFKLTSTQVGFTQVALLRILQDVEYPERIAWVEDFKKMETGLDAAIFMTEAKLKLRYAIDVKKMMRESTEQRRSVRTH